MGLGRGVRVKGMGSDRCWFDQWSPTETREACTDSSGDTVIRTRE